jgi:hypothetical protein
LSTSWAAMMVMRLSGKVMSCASTMVEMVKCSCCGKHYRASATTFSLPAICSNVAPYSSKISRWCKMRS